jgi:fatty acid desaturase
MHDLGISPRELAALLVLRPGHVALKVAVLVGSWAALGWAVLAAPAWAWVPLWLVMGFVINGLVQLAHETWHGNLLPRRWQNTLAGTLLGLVVGIAHGPLRHDHLAHHRYNRTERDPDAYNVGRRSFWPSVLHYTIVVLGLPLSVIYFNVLYPLQHYDRRALGRHALVLLGYVAIHAIVWWLLARHGLVRAALLVWIVPVLFTSPFNGLKSLADHHANDWRGNRYRTATTVRTHRLITYAWNGLSYHLDHHLFPRVPGYNLPALHARIRPALAARNAPLFDGYARVMVAALLAGPLVVDEDVRLVTLERKRR